MDDSDDIDEVPVLSGSTLAALKDFYADRDAREKAFEDLKAKAEGDGEKAAKLTMDTFEENWNDSQFWYSQETATVLAQQLLQGSSKETQIAIVSAPSVFVQLKNILTASDMLEEDKPTIYLLEFDERFRVFDEFVFYDFRSPIKLPPALKGIIDCFVVDPPFLSEDCQTKAALTVRWLSKTPEGESHSKSLPPKVVVCTGERMQSLVERVYRPQRVRATTFEPVHAKGLSNEFYCYANFESSEWKWRKEKDEENMH